MSEMVERVARGWNSITDRWIARRDKMHDTLQWEVVHDWGGDLISDDTMKVISRHHSMEAAQAEAKRLEDAARARAAIAATRELSDREALLLLRTFNLRPDELHLGAAKEWHRGRIDAALNDKQPGHP